jgi:hypothetical protein
MDHLRGIHSPTVGPPRPLRDAPSVETPEEQTALKRYQVECERPRCESLANRYRNLAQLVRLGEPEYLPIMQRILSGVPCHRRHLPAEI